MRRLRDACLATLAALLLLGGALAACERRPAPARHTPAPCIRVDPQDEPPALDFDAANCKNVP